MIHKTVSLYDPFWKRNVDIDAKIAPLIQSLWNCGIETDNSCEDNQPKGWIWINFPSSNDAKHFLDLVAEYETGVDNELSLYERIYGEWEGEYAWDYRIFPRDQNMGWILSEDEDEQNDNSQELARTVGYSADTFCVGTPKDTNTIFSVSIRFHNSDYEEVLKRIQEKEPKPALLP